MKHCYYYSINIISIVLATAVAFLLVEATDPAVESACSKTEFQADCQASITSKLGPVINDREILIAALSVLEDRAILGVDQATQLTPTTHGDLQGMLFAAISDFTNVKVGASRAKSIINETATRKVDPEEVKSIVKDANKRISHVNEMFAMEQNPVKSITLSMQIAARNALRLVPASL